MADKIKKTPFGATVPPPDQNADFITQLEQTFQRGVVSAELDVGGLFSKNQGGGSVKTFWGEAARISEGPAGVHDTIFKRMKEIANAFGGRFTVHAPMQAEPAGMTSIEKARAANILKKTIEYADKMGAGVITVHPIGSMGYYFVEPFLNQKMPVENPFFLAKNEKELKDLFKKYDVKDPLLKDQIQREWANFIQVLPTIFAEKFGAQAGELVENFSTRAADYALHQLLNKYGDNVNAINQMLLENYHPRVADRARARLSRVIRQVGDKFVVDKNELAKLKSELAARVSDRRFLGELTNSWLLVDLASLKPVKMDGQLVKSYKDELETRKQAWELAMSHLSRFGPFKDSIKQIEKNVEDTFSKLLKDPEVKKMLKKGNIKIALENLFPARPEKGYMAGFAYFYEPEHMAKIIKKLRAIAKANGIPEDRITMTFDIGHAAASKIKPSKFLKELKKRGIKPGHVHIVGGRGFGHEHIAWGDWLDEVSRMDPDILKKVMDLGIVNIEGGLGHHDTEVTLNAMWDQGMPLEAILAMSGGPEPSPGLLRYAGFGDASYWQDRAQAYWSSGFASKGFYSFQYENTPGPMRTAFGAYTAPALFGGGYSIGPGRTPNVWSSSQPLLYSSKKSS